MKCLISIWLAFFLVAVAHPQDIAGLESRVFNLRLALAEKERVLASLADKSAVLGSQLAGEQKKSTKDAQVIAYLKNEILAVTAQRNKLSADIVAVTGELLQLKATLTEVYNGRITQLGARQDLSKEEAAELASLSVRRLLLQPGLSSFSINPEKLLSLNPGQAATAAEKELYKDYVNTAIREVADAGRRTREMLEEAGSLLRLSAKLRWYLNTDPLAGPLTGGAGSVVAGAVRSGDPLTGFTGEFTEKVNSFQEVITLLTPVVSGSRQSGSTLPDVNGMSVKQYARLLKTALSRIDSYRVLLEEQLR